MITVEMFIGADNETHEVNRTAIADILDRRHEGWTMTDSTGSWHGEREQSVRIIVADRRKAIRHTLRALCSELHQEAVAWHEVSPLHFVSA